jgi:hypothetical protein
MLVLIALLASLIGGTGVSSNDITSGGPSHSAAVVAPAGGTVVSSDDITSGGPSAHYLTVATTDDGMSGGPAAR